MKENWLNENLCSFDEKVRVELGPQIIELDCNKENLDDKVTSAHYQVGKKDALGIIIGINPKMHCVDWRSKLKPKVWKVYQWQLVVAGDAKLLLVKILELLDTGEILKEDLHKHKAQYKFVKVDEYESKEEALNFAKTLAGEM